MAEFEMKGSTSGSPVDPPATATPAPENAGTGAGMVQGYALELNHYYARLNAFTDMEPDEVLRELSGISARLTEMRSNCFRLADSGDRASRAADKLRIKEIDPMLEECERQFKYHSRIQAIREFDLKMTGGAT